MELSYRLALPSAMQPIAMDALSSDPQPSPRRSAAVRQTPGPQESADAALLELGRALKDAGYRFTTVTPASHARVLARPASAPPSLADIFGWSRRFRLGQLDGGLAKLASRAGILEQQGEWVSSSVRFSTLGQQLFVHSAYPTDQADAVFFGPDTYRFARAIDSAVAGMTADRVRGLWILDVGAGSGAGGLHAAALAARARPRLTLTDINRRALRYCRINAALNVIDPVDVVESDLFANVSGAYDLIMANPPYLVDKLARTYRHGGGALGSDLSVRFVEQGIARLAPGGRLLLYTGSAIVGGRDFLHEALSDRLRGCRLRMTYEEVDPDVFGEELDHPPYDVADRIAVVAVTIDLLEGVKHAPQTR